MKAKAKVKPETKAQAKAIPAIVIKAVTALLDADADFLRAQGALNDKQIALGLELRKHTQSQKEAAEMLKAILAKLNRTLDPAYISRAACFAHPADAELLDLAIEGDPSGKIKRGENWESAAKLTQDERRKVASGSIIRTKQGKWIAKKASNFQGTKRGRKAASNVEKLKTLADNFVTAIVALKVDAEQIAVALCNAFDATKKTKAVDVAKAMSLKTA